MPPVASLKMLWITLASFFVLNVDGHAYMAVPAPRQVVHGVGPKFGGSGDGSMGGAGNVQNLNAGIGGGEDGRSLEVTKGHSLCGDKVDRKAFMAGGAYGPSLKTIQGPYSVHPALGGTIDITVVVTAYHLGWFEFRLCEDRGAGFGADTAVTQECFNKHVLRFDPSVVRKQHNGEMADGRSDPSDYGPSKAEGWSVRRDETICTKDFDEVAKRTKWGGQEVGIDGEVDGPKGSCCNQGGDCGSAVNNETRWVLPAATPDGTYKMTYKIPPGITCDRCVLQFQYVTANSMDKYPEAFWNCADISIKSCSTNEECDALKAEREKVEAANSSVQSSNPTPNSTAKVPEGAQCGGNGWTGSTQCEDGLDCSFQCSGCDANTHLCIKKKVENTSSSGGTTGSDGNNNNVGNNPGGCPENPDCGGCMWPAANNACYKDWPKATCDNFASAGYKWCGISSNSNSSSNTDSNSSSSSDASLSNSNSAGRWVAGDFPKCSSTCGTPQKTVTRKVECVAVSPSSTSSASSSPKDSNGCPKKLTLQQCNDFKAKCQTHCNSKANASVATNQCWGSGETTYTKCLCTDNSIYLVPGYTCSHIDCTAAQKNTCESNAATVGWRANSWSMSCPLQCGISTVKRTRTVVCSKEGNVVADSECKNAGKKPASSEFCPATRACNTPSSRQKRWPTSKVAWAFYDLSQPFVSANEIIAQKINYIVLSSGNIDGKGKFLFPCGSSKSGGEAKICVNSYEKLLTESWFKTLHDAGVVIGVSIGDQASRANLVLFHSTDAIDFSWAGQNVDLAKIVNRGAAAFRNSGFVVTTSPRASQLTSGCGYGTGTASSMNNMAGLNTELYDGIFLNWFEAGCSTKFLCPRANCYSENNKARCFDMDFAKNTLTRFATVGACSSVGSQVSSTSFKNCDALKCTKIDLAKIIVGSGTTYKWLPKNSQPDGQIDSTDMINLLKHVNAVKGFGAYSVNRAVKSGTATEGEATSPNFFKDVATGIGISAPAAGRQLKSVIKHHPSRRSLANCGSKPKTTKICAATKACSTPSSPTPSSPTPSSPSSPTPSSSNSSNEGVIRKILKKMTNFPQGVTAQSSDAAKFKLLQSRVGTGIGGVAESKIDEYIAAIEKAAAKYPKFLNESNEQNNQRELKVLVKIMEERIQIATILMPM
eukprot:g6118.t1